VSSKLSSSGGGEAALGLQCGGFDAGAIYQDSSCFYWIYRPYNTLYVKEKGTSFAGFSTTQISGIAINWNTDVFGMRLNSAGRVEYLHLPHGQCREPTHLAPPRASTRVITGGRTTDIMTTPGLLTPRLAFLFFVVKRK
jgi:hypothetical protein